MMEPCDLVTRRRFIAGLGASAATVTAAGYAINVFNRGPEPMTAASNLATPEPAPTPPFGSRTTPGRTLVVVELGGGNDSLNMVVPHGDSAYFDARGNVAIENPIDLDGTVGLHPNLPNLATLYTSGSVAIVEGVGYPNSDLSHFVSMNAWWTGAPAFASPTGWLGRYLDETVGYSDPLAGVSIGPGPSQAMVGANSFAVSVQDASGLQPNTAEWIDSKDELIGAWSGIVPATWEPSLVGDIYRVIKATVDARNEINEPLSPLVVERGDSLRNQLQVAAALITSDIAPAVIYVHGRGDYDTHINQVQRHGALMTELDTAIDEFVATTAGHDVAMLTASEFGRRVRANGTGTDHGAAGTHLLIGRSVRGGRYGETTPLSRPDHNGNVPPSVDFRSVYTTVLEGFLGVDANQILKASYENLGFFSAV